MAYAIISALNQVIKQSKETTISALLGEFKLCADHLLTAIKNDPDFADRTLLSMRALVRIYQRMAQKVEYQQEMKDIRTDIFLKGDTFAKHSLQCNSLIGKFSKPYLREGMVS